MQATGSMTAEQRYYWRIALELKLRKSGGDAFQDFFSDIMGKLHGDDFVRVCLGLFDTCPCDATVRRMAQA